MSPKKYKSCIYNVLIFCNICLEITIIIMIQSSQDFAAKTKVCLHSKLRFYYVCVVCCVVSHTTGED